MCQISVIISYLKDHIHYIIYKRNYFYIKEIIFEYYKIFCGLNSVVSRLLRIKKSSYLLKLRYILSITKILFLLLTTEVFL